MGSYPEPKTYEAEFRSGEERALFSAWYVWVMTKFLTIERNCFPTAWTTSVYWAGMLCFTEFVFEISQDGPIRQIITITSICNKVFRTMFLVPGSVGIIPKGVYRMGDRQSVEALQWLAYIGLTRKNITHADNGREVHLAWLPNVNFDWYYAETNEVFEYLEFF